MLHQFTKSHARWQLPSGVFRFCLTASNKGV